MEPLRSEETALNSSGLISRTRKISAELPKCAVLSVAESPRTVWAAPGEATVIGSGTAATLSATGPDRFSVIRSEAEELFAVGDVHAGTLVARPRLFGGFSFHEDHNETDPWGGFPSARFVLPRTQVTYDGDETWVTVNAVDATAESVEQHLEAVVETLRNAEAGPRRDPPGVKRRHRTMSKEGWHRSVTAATDRITAGELRKVVLAQAMEAHLEAPLSVPDVLSRLGDSYPDCTRFLFEPADGSAAFFGATPEGLVDLRGRTVETGALAGTTGRGDTPTEDDWLAEELLDDEKNVHEHELVAEAIREQLTPYAASMRSGTRRVRRLANVQHLETPITAELAEDEHVLTLVEALHPTPAVGGLPPDRALETIRDTEPFERGWYAAPIGWFDAAGHGSFAVALRSAVARGDVVTLFAGVGIVTDSDPDREWDEVQLKYRPILDELE
ncbi:MAG: isochorismate synthase [Natronomonas sp.]